MRHDNDWDLEEALNFYNIPRWGEEYFHINSNGKLCLRPAPHLKKVKCIEISNVVEEVKAQGIQLPAVIRFHDILRSQVEKHHNVFHKTIIEAGLTGNFQGVYPIKVNQLREVVEEIVDAGKSCDFGLEAGSKAEVMAALALNTNVNSLTLLNGYKDNDYIRLGLLGKKIGRNIIIIIEKLSELNKVLDLSKEMGVVPAIGVRAKLHVKGAGRWANSSGDDAKFGLSIPEILQAVHILKESDMLDSLKLFHFHMGSQVTQIGRIKDALAEGVRIYVELRKLGASIEYFDVGGGLAVDYTGLQGAEDSSMNYSLEDYASDVVYSLKEGCDIAGVKHPNIVTESGRAITAHHSCVVFDVFGEVDSSSELELDKIFNQTSDHPIVKGMYETESEINEDNLLESYHDAIQRKKDAREAFKLGVLTLVERAEVENLFFKAATKIQKLSRDLEILPDDLKTLNEMLTAQYLCNFSVFQSAADCWAIDQVLPVIPLDRLNERPTRKVKLADVTCDSDGKIDHFVQDGEMRSSIFMHDLKKDEDYHVGLFLTGAYQDIMGDNHNLFGRLNEVHIFSDNDDEKGFYIEEVIRGNSAAEVLSSLQYNPTAMALSIKKDIDKCIKAGKIRPREGVSLVDFYESSLNSYTYPNFNT